MSLLSPVNLKRHLAADIRDFGPVWNAPLNLVRYKYTSPVE